MKREVKMNRELMHAITPDLSPELAAEMTQYIRGLPYYRKEQAMKRKLSVGLVLAMVLALLAVGALAATLLGGKAFVDEFLAPKALDTQSDMFTAEELSEIMALAAEKGVELPEDMLNKLKHAEARERGYYKESLLRAVAKTELGFYPSTWTIEDQAWFAQLLIACGLNEYANAVLPEGDEILQTQAEQIAMDYIRDNYNAEVDVTDAALYRRHVQYQDYFESEYRKGRMWFITYEPLDLWHDEYRFQIWSDGRLDSAKIGRRGLTEDASVVQVLYCFSIYDDQYGFHDAWTEEIWLQCQELLQKAVDRHGYTQLIGNDMARGVLMQEYVVPDGTESISREQALQLALEAEGAQNDRLLSTGAVLLKEGDAKVWKVTVRSYERASYYAQVNAQTGDTQVFKAEANEAVCRGYVLESVAEQLRSPVQAKPRPTAEPQAFYPAPGQKEHWSSRYLPEWYVQELGELGYTTDNAGDMMNKWSAAYGEDSTFWPAREYAIDYIAHEAFEGTTTLPGLPDESDISEEQAKELAVQTAGAAANDEVLIARLWFNAPLMEDHMWIVQYVNTGEKHGEVMKEVKIDAKTGSVWTRETMIERIEAYRGVEEGEEAKIVQPGPGDLTYEEALAIADAAMRKVCAGILTEEEMDAFLVEGTLYEHFTKTSERTWYFNFYSEGYDPWDSDCFVYFDAQTGEIDNAQYAPAALGHG